MWELYKNSDGSPKAINCNKPLGLARERCFICGQFFVLNDSLYVVRIPINYVEMISGKDNKIAHDVCWGVFCQGITDDLTLVTKLSEHKRPKRKTFTAKQIECINVFEKVAYECGFKKRIKMPWGLKAKKYNTSSTLAYNVFWDDVTYNDRRKSGLLDRFFEKEFEVDVKNKMNKILGVDEFDDYSAHKIIQDALKSVKW